jgi:hypothetical protein
LMRGTSCSLSRTEPKVDSLPSTRLDGRSSRCVFATWRACRRMGRPTRKVSSIPGCPRRALARRQCARETTEDTARDRLPPEPTSGSKRTLLAEPTLCAPGRRSLHALIAVPPESLVEPRLLRPDASRASNERPEARTLEPRHPGRSPQKLQVPGSYGSDLACSVHCSMIFSLRDLMLRSSSELPSSRARMLAVMAIYAGVKSRFCPVSRLNAVA